MKGRPEWVMYIQFVLTKRNYIRTVSVIDPVWLIKYFPEIFDENKIKNKDSKKALRKVIRNINRYK